MIEEEKQKKNIASNDEMKKSWVRRGGAGLTGFRVRIGRIIEDSNPCYKVIGKSWH